MPTARLHLIAETDAVALALGRAARRWPDETRAELLVRLTVLGGDVLAERDEVSTRDAALDRVAGRYDDLYGPGYLADLRSDWPE